MARATGFMWVLFTAVAITQTKPLNSTLDESINEIDHGNHAKSKPLGLKERPRNSALPTNEVPLTTTRTADATVDSAASTARDTTALPFEEISTTRPGPLSWFLAPLSQKIQFSPQSFLQDRFVLLKEVLNNLGVNVQNATAKQLGTGGLVHFTGPSDTGFYTNRLEPAGFLGGNGWFANKGGILGGPGAIVSTGSLLTDYPTPYRRK
ncbi:uncharacterized protein LOC109864231 [Pseudomyrmex gracilis]|uniref:uncharacterized protein LOC109864231 n=1 Tax=Pseudomyrmex gracilis TaxID=219809 RepID=UPI000994B432|nr:uncharacterized protein LOC109864231 [Pseudomyrmex gracilis]